MTRRQELRVVISGDASSLSRTFAKAGQSASQFEGKIQGTVSRVGGALRRMSVGAIGAAGFGIGALVKAGVDYEKQMARVEGVTNATGAQMKTLGNLAKQLGADTKFSAGEAATAMYELGSAGFKVSDMSKVLPSTLALAAASSIELKDAAEIAANALNGFGLSSSQMGHVADVLAQTVNRTSTEMSDLQLSLKYIGPIAKLTGQDFETMLAAVGELGNAGIKGEQAGTTLRGGLIRLTKPTKMVKEGFSDIGLKAKDLYGPKGLKPLTQIIPILERGLKGVDKSTRNAALAQIFGTEAATGWAAIIQQGSKALIANTKANRDSEGAAKKAADTMNDTVAGAWENLTGSIETTGISIFEKFEKPIKSSLLSVAGAINEFPKLFKTLKSGGRSTATALVEAFGDVFGLKSNNQKLGGALEDMFKQVDWKGIGDAIADGISGGVKLSGDFAHGVEEGIGAALSHVDGRKMMSGLLRVTAEAIGSLFSPRFWYDNFSNIFATVSIAIPVAKFLHFPGADKLYNLLSKPLFGAIKGIGRGLTKAFKKIGGEGVTGFLGGLEEFLPRTAGVLFGLVAGAGKWLKGLPGKFRGAGSGAVSALVGAIGKGVSEVAGAVGRLVGRAVKALGRLIPDFVREGARMGAELISGMVKGVKGLPGKVGGAIKKAIKGIGGFFGIGEGIGRVQRSTGGSTGLKGARGSMAPFAAIGSRYGLSVSSGRRPGAITSSGNQSYHSTGEAIDEAGSKSGMLAYFKYLKQHAGGELAELIYTPGGMGIKDGRPYRYSGQVAADHFDHVHVAVDSGRPGVGDGLGRGAIVNLWTRAGGSPARSNIAAAIAMAESGGKTDASHRNSNGSIDRGLWQINSVHGAQSTFSPLGNARAAVKISDNGANWNPWTTYHSGAYKRFLSDDGGTGGGDRDRIQSRIDRNASRIAALRGQLADLPRGRAGRERRARIQDEIRKIQESTRNLRVDLRDAPTAVERRERNERSGSRLVNQVARPFQKAISRSTRIARSLATQIEDADTEFGLTQRRQSQTDENLGDPKQRAHRLGEIGELTKLKQKQLGRQRKRATALRRAISSAEKQLNALHKARKGARGAKRAKMNERIRAFDDRLVDLKAELKALGYAIKETELDIGDLAVEAVSVAGTADDQTAVTDRVSDLVSLIDLRERAGTITAEQARAQKQQVIAAVLGGALGPLDERQRLQLMGDLRDVQQQAVEATNDLTTELTALREEMATSNAIAQSRMAIGLAEAERALADVVSRQLGMRVGPRAQMPGTGALSRL